jgi:cell division protein FtsB
VPDSKRPDPKRRSPGPRPGRGSDTARERPRSSAARREHRPAEEGTAPESAANAEGTAHARSKESTAESITTSIAAAVARQSEQRLGFTARRAAILAAVVCVLTLTIAGPVRTYFAQRAELAAIEASNAQLELQKAQLEAEKVKINDPAYIEAQARDRLGMVMPGETPYQIQLPNSPAPASEEPGASPPQSPNGPWYTTLWHTIADAPHNVPPPPTVPPGG